MEEKINKLKDWCLENSKMGKKWYLEVWFNRAYEERIEWAVGLSFGYSRDYIDIGNNFFGDTLDEALYKALKFISNQSSLDLK